MQKKLYNKTRNINLIDYLQLAGYLLIETKFSQNLTLVKRLIEDIIRS